MNKEAKNRYFAEISRIVSSSICPPTVRMFLIVLFDNSVDGYYVSPAIGILNSVVNDFCKEYTDEYPEEYKTEEELLRNGWTWRCQCNRTVPVFWDGQCQIAQTAEAISAGTAGHSVIACPWPYDEKRDNAAIAKELGQLRAAWASEIKTLSPSEIRQLIDSEIKPFWENGAQGSNPNN